MQNSWNKHGADAFIFEVLEPIDDVNLLIEREQHWFAHFAGRTYNLCPIAGTRRGYKLPPEACAAIGQRRKGVPHTPEACARMSASRLGKKPTAETRAKMSAARMGRIVSEETREKLRKANAGQKSWLAGKTLSEEWKAKIRASHLARRDTVKVP